MDRLDDAAIAFRRATELGPENVDAWINLGVVLSTAGDIEGAEKVLRRSIEMRPEHFVGWLNLIGLLYREGRSKEAEDLHQNALEIIPNFDDFTDDINEFIENARDE
jgi:tetratricopeptide (TPR) repeat protein